MRSGAPRPYTGRDIAFVIPTKDRPDRVATTLASLVQQTVPCGRVIVVASGRDIRDVVLAFSRTLDVEYHHSLVPGQMRQRSHGISAVPHSARLVGFLDDDIVPDQDSVEKMVAFWNRIEPETAGVAFNLMGLRRRNRSLLGSLFRRTFPPGHVYKSGFSIPLSELENSIYSKRLNGGATIWRKEILGEFKQLEIDAAWAICEDLIFSYPIGKKYPLRVCAEARVLHDHPVDTTAGSPRHRIRGRTVALWQLYFVTLNPDLSVAAYALTAFALSVCGIVIGTAVPGRAFYRGFYFGLAEGAIKGLLTLWRGADLADLLRDRREARPTRSRERPVGQS